jgi:hypothetical protein
VDRRPAPNIHFQVATWVPVSNLTETELQVYEKTLPTYNNVPTPTPQNENENEMAVSPTKGEKATIDEQSHVQLQSAAAVATTPAFPNGMDKMGEEHPPTTTTTTTSSSENEKVDEPPLIKKQRLEQVGLPSEAAPLDATQDLSAVDSTDVPLVQSTTNTNMQEEMAGKRKMSEPTLAEPATKKPKLVENNNVARTKLAEAVSEATATTVDESGVQQQQVTTNSTLAATATATESPMTEMPVTNDNNAVHIIAPTAANGAISTPAAASATADSHPATETNAQDS